MSGASKLGGKEYFSWELPLLMLMAALAFMSIPIVRGGLGLSSDTLNHHIYLGWVANSTRFNLDLFAASYQSYQYPYLYWPIYKLAIGGASGTFAGVIIASLNLFLIPPIWMLARACIPGITPYDALMRLFSVVLALMSCVILLSLETTSNDLLVAIPLVWAIALAILPMDQFRQGRMTPERCILLSGVLAGVSTAFKLSNGPIAILIPGLWCFSGITTRQRVRYISIGAGAAIGGFLTTYGYWGWLLWRWFGNPIYPMYDGLFTQIRSVTGWMQP